VRGKRKHIEGTERQKINTPWKTGKENRQSTNSQLRKVPTKTLNKKKEERKTTNKQKRPTLHTQNGRE